MEVTVHVSSNQPLFGSAMRILQFRREALGRRALWPLREAAEALEMSTKSIKRYIQFLGLTDTDGEGRPLIEIVHVNGRPHIQSRAKRRQNDAKA